MRITKFASWSSNTLRVFEVRQSSNRAWTQPSKTSERIQSRANPKPKSGQKSFQILLQSLPMRMPQFLI